MGLLIVRVPIPGFSFFYPGDVAAILLLCLVAFRTQSVKSPTLKNYIVFATVLLTYLLLISLINEVDPIRRLFKLTILFLLAGAIAARKIDLIAGLTGLSVALLINIPLFFSGLTPDTYAGKLTGVIGDKNVAGLYYAVIPLLALMISKNMILRILIILSAFTALVLTGSRGSLAAFAFALLWLFLAPRLRTFGKLILASILLPIYVWINDNFSQVADFSDRVGSDALRSRIDAASFAKTEAAPWYGMGLGESQVNLDGKIWFFHNSYAALLVEGGIPLLIAIIGLYLVVGLRLFQPKILNPVATYLETATVVILLCSLRLGEVFFTFPGILIIGLGLSLSITYASLSKNNTEPNHYVRN